MNELTKKLAKQAGFNILDDTEFNGHIFRNVIETFAGLVVKECARIIEAQDVDPAFKLRMSYSVKERFGVKE
jgi:hypothetical protein